MQAASRGGPLVLDDGTLGKIFNAATGVWTLVAMAAVALFRAWPHILGKINERRRDSADEKAGDWERIRKERDRLRDLLAHCDKEKGDWMRRAITAEATLQGYGEARQIQAVEQAMKRLPPGDEQ